MNEVKDYMSKLYDLKDTDRVFPFTKSYINNAMARACKKSGVKKIRIHDIRHPYVKPTTKKFITFFEVFRAAS